MALPRQRRTQHAIAVTKKSRQYRKATGKQPRMKHGRRLEYNVPVQFDPSCERDVKLIELFDVAPHLIPDRNLAGKPMLLLENINVVDDPSGLHQLVFEAVQ